MIRLSNEYIEVDVGEYGAEVVKAVDKKTEKDIIWVGDEKYWMRHGPVLFPLTGSVLHDKYRYKGKEYSIIQHGFAKVSTFDVTQVTNTSATLELRSSEETKKCYPFDFLLKVKFALEGRKVVVDYTVENTGKETSYFSVGAHEGYMLEGGLSDYHIVFPKKLTLDAYPVLDCGIGRDTYRVLTDTDTLPLCDDWFKVDALVFKDIDFGSLKIVKNDGSFAYDVHFDGFPTLLIWSIPTAPFVCIEPWHGFPDFADFKGELNEKDLILSLEPGKTYTCRHSFEME